MRPEGDPELLLRAGRRCARLAAELALVESTLDTAAGGRAMRWSGTAAVVFSARATQHRRLVADTRRAVEHLGRLATVFGHELAELQQRERAHDRASAAPSDVEARIELLRTRFRRQLRSVETALTQVRLRLSRPPDRWTGPVTPPAGLQHRRPLPTGRWTGPVAPPAGTTRHRVPLPRTERWTGPVLPPAGVTRHRVPLPAPASAPPVLRGAPS